MMNVCRDKNSKKGWTTRCVATFLCAVSLLGLAGCGNAKEVSNELSYEMEIEVPRADASEKRPEGNRANIMNPMSGGAEAAAEKLRESILEAGDAVSVTGKTYYISTGGDDLNDGLSPETAFGSLDVLRWLKLSEGDAVLLERDSVFRITEPIAAVSGVTYGAYGSGDKPCIYGSPKNYAEGSLWTPSRMQNVWKLDFGYGDAGNIVFNHGEYVGIKKMVGLNQLKETGDFYHNVTDGIVYLYCADGNPGNCYEDIEISPHSILVYLNVAVSDVTIDNWCMKYSGGFAVSGAQANRGITITNCEIGYIGGSKLNLNTRYGNAIQFWNGTQNTVVNNCWIYQVFDTAITFQGTSHSAYENISFCSNLLEYNDMDIEIWDEGKNFAVSNLVIEDNIMRFNSHGWGTRNIDSGNRGGAASFKFKFGNCVSCSAILKNNIFDCPNYNAVYCILPSAGALDINVSGNAVYANSNRASDDMVRYGAFVDNKIPDAIKATNQSELEAAFHRFDASATEIQWLP